MNDKIRLNLVDLVTSIRDELEQADKARLVSGKAALFQLSGLELELNFVVSETAGAKGGFDIKVLSVGGDVSVRTEEVHKVKLTFEIPDEAKTVLGARARGSEAKPEFDITPVP
jgi:hypothetical protein